MAFYIITLVIIQVFVAYIVDEFKFKLKEYTTDCAKHGVPFEHCLCTRKYIITIIKMQYQKYEVIRLLCYLANRKFITTVRLSKSDMLMVEDELEQQTNFVQKMNCVIKNLKSKIKGISYAHIKVAINKH